MNRRQALLRIMLEWRRLRIRRRRIRRLVKEWWTRPIFMARRQQGAWLNLIPTLRQTDPKLFFNFLRMSPAQFDALLSVIEDDLQKFSWRESITPGERLCITLRYLASGDSMTSLSYLFRVAKCTISLIIFETCNILWNRLSPIVFEPFSEDSWREVAEAFDTRWNFPHCVGALDGKHCVVQAFPGSGSEYYNHKGTHSLILLALVSANYKFLVVDIGAAGRNNDAGVFKSSLLGQALNNGTLRLPPPSVLPGTNEMFPYVIVGDAAFPLKTNLMRPYPGDYLSEDKTIFNYRLSRARNVVENAFGILSSRWRIYKKPIIARKALVKVIIKATVCLHNYLITDELNVRPHQRSYIAPNTADVLDFNGEEILGQWRNEVSDRDAIRELHPTLRMGARNFSVSASDVREKFTDYFLGPGCVRWQWRKLPGGPPPQE